MRDEQPMVPPTADPAGPGRAEPRRDGGAAGADGDRVPDALTSAVDDVYGQYEAYLASMSRQAARFHGLSRAARTLIDVASSARRGGGNVDMILTALVEGLEFALDPGEPKDDLERELRAMVLGAEA